jgi:hypothetical protein
MLSEGLPSAHSRVATSGYGPECGGIQEFKAQEGEASSVCQIDEIAVLFVYLL